MIQFRIEKDGKELEPKQIETLKNATLINVVCFLMAIACAQGWLLAPLVWGAAAISIVSLLLYPLRFWTVLIWLGTWIYLLAEVYENSLSAFWQNAAFFGFLLSFWAEPLWNLLQRRRKAGDE